MSSFLEKDLGGLYNPTLRFAFTNITDEDFTSYWDKIPIVVKAHETIELSNATPIPGAGHVLAVKMTGELVDKIMIGSVKLDEVEKNQPYYRSPKGGDLGIPAVRKIWEDQILRALDPDEESPAIQVMRKQIRKEIAGEVEELPVQPLKVPTSIEEFADINNTNQPKTEVAKKPTRTKKIA